MIGAFNLFDPINEPVQYWVDWEVAQNIIWRARALARGRSKEEMNTILSSAEALIDKYFANQRAVMIKIIEREGRRDLIDYYADGQFREFRSEAFDQYAIRERYSISDLDALAEALEQYFDPSDVDVKNVREFEYFGCLALFYFERFILVRDYSLESGFRKKRTAPIPSYARVRLGKILLEAFDCVAYGERAQARADIAERYEKKIEELKERQDSIVQARIQEMTDAVKQELESAESERRKREARERNDVRHQENRELRARVVGWYASEYRNFPSAAKAAKAFCQRLNEEGIEREQRTIEKWLRSYAKQSGIALTP